MLVGDVKITKNKKGLIVMAPQEFGFKRRSHGWGERYAMDQTRFACNLHGGEKGSALTPLAVSPLTSRAYFGVNLRV